MKRKALLALWLTFLFAAIIALFWNNEFKYSLPTPVPAKHRDVALGTHIDLEKKVRVKDKPIFIHFFNPDCPCSRFNVPHVSELIKNYGDKIDFNIVVLNKENNYTAAEIQSKFDTDIPVIFDTTIAEKCGVYSTPQAVLIDASQKLYYRGNYNKTRYCTNADTNYVQMAIDSLLSQKSNPSFNVLALKSYGCSLPACTK